VIEIGKVFPSEDGYSVQYRNLDVPEQGVQTTSVNVFVGELIKSAMRQGRNQVRAQLRNILQEE
jgi:hypothetical protein